MAQRWSSPSTEWRLVFYSYYKIYKNGIFFLVGGEGTADIFKSVYSFTFVSLLHSSGWYKWKFNVPSIFYKLACPPKIKTNPGTKKEYPRQVNPEGTSYNPKTW